MARRRLCTGRWIRLGWCGKAGCRESRVEGLAAWFLAMRLPLFCGGVVDDLGEGLGVQAGSAYESAVDVLQTAEGFGVVGFDGSAVEDADGGGERGREGFVDLGADDLVCLGGDFRGSGSAGADGPDRL